MYGLKPVPFTNAAGLHGDQAVVRAHPQKSVLVQPGGFSYAGLGAVHLDLPPADPRGSLSDACRNRRARIWFGQP